MERAHMMKTDLVDKIVVVTGGCGQLGRQYSSALADEGSKVVILDTPAAVDSFETSSAVAALPCDITKKSDIEASLTTIQAKWGSPFGLINNAALDSPPDAGSDANGPFESYSEDVWDKVIDVNLKGVFLCCQVFGAAMAQAGKGSIVNISSIYGQNSPDQSIYEYRRQQGDEFYKPVAYTASKSGVIGISKYLGTYWVGSGVRVNTLTLAGVFNNQETEFLENYCARIPIGRMADESEYNGAVLFLLSDASKYMTGSNLVIDGGWSAI